MTAGVVPRLSTGRSLLTAPTTAPTAPAATAFRRRDLLRWLYLGRITVVTGVEIGVLFRWLQAPPELTFVATFVFLSSLVFTSASYWYTHVLNREPGVNFLYGQVVFDILVVTAIVHVTGGSSSFFAPLYILVITAGALLLPLPGGMLIGALASILYFADITWGHGGTLGAPVALQIFIFAAVAVATGWVGDRVRRAGMALGEVESELRQLRLDTTDILGALSTGVVTLEGDGRLAYMNSAAEGLLGLQASQWMGGDAMPALEGVAPGLATILRRSLSDRVPMARYKTVARRGDETVTLGVTTTVLEREGGLPAVTAIFQDISDHERIEELNLRNERLSAVAELSASLAHEIKNPLASIRSAVEQIGSPSLDREDRLTLQNLVKGESDRLSRLLSEFIEFSRLRIGELGDVDLSKVARDCVALARQHPSCADGSEILVDVERDPILVRGDADLIHRAVFNLVLNAVQFAGPGGTVKVHVGDTPVRTLGAGPSGARRSLLGGPGARIVVEDSGPGVDPGETARIFDPFFTTREGGSGLGLSVANRTIEAHEGTIFVEESDLGGARFVIDLPVGAVKRPTPANEAAK